MISNEKMEEYWKRYQSEGVSKNLSMQAFCSMNNVPYNAFEKYLKLRRHFSTAHRIQVTDVPGIKETSGATSQEEPKMSAGTPLKESAASENRIRIMVDIRMSNGINVRQRNLDHKGLLDLVEKLEVLC